MPAALLPFCAFTARLRAARAVMLALLALLTGHARAETPTAAPDTLARIAARGEMVLAHAQGSSNFSFVVRGQARPQGLAIDLCQLVFEQVKARLGRPGLRLRYLYAPERLQSIRTQTADIECMPSSHTARRQTEFGLSYPWFVTPTRFAVRADAGIADLKALAGKRIALVPGTSNTARALQALTQRGIQVHVVDVPHHTQALTQLQAGQVDAVHGDEVALWGIWQMLQGDKPAQSLRFLAPSLSIEGYSLIFAHGDPEFQHLVDATLAQAYRATIQDFAAARDATIAIVGCTFIR